MRQHPNRYADAAGPPRAVHEVEVEGVVEEELGDQEARSAVDLRLQIGEIGIEAVGLGVDLREAGAADRELGVAGADQLRELGGAAQAPFGLDEVGLAPRRVAP